MGPHVAGGDPKRERFGGEDRLASWFELMTTDLSGAKAFYADIFNWSFEK